MSQAHQGACRCGRVRFEVRAGLDYVVDCNCSVCRRKGALWHPAADADLRILSGEVVRCIDGIDLSSLKVRRFDGQNWEASAKAYYDRIKKAPAA
jgi:hypothetical protein